MTLRPARAGSRRMARTVAARQAHVEQYHVRPLAAAEIVQGVTAVTRRVHGQAAHAQEPGQQLTLVVVVFDQQPLAEPDRRPRPLPRLAAVPLPQPAHLLVELADRLVGLVEPGLQGAVELA